MILGENNPKAQAAERRNKEMQAELDREAARARKIYIEDRDERIALNAELRRANEPTPAPVMQPVAIHVPKPQQPTPLTSASKGELSKVFMEFHNCPPDQNGYAKVMIVQKWAALRGYPLTGGYSGGPDNATIRTCIDELRNPDFALVFDPSGEISRRQSAAGAVAARSERQ